MVPAHPMPLRALGAWASSLSPGTLSGRLLVSFLNQSVAGALREEGQREELNQCRDACESQEDWPAWTEHKWRLETRICCREPTGPQGLSLELSLTVPTQVIGEGGGHPVLAKMSLPTKNIPIKNRGKDLVGEDICTRTSS